ncbi:PhoD-like phosphatase [Nostoc edaphicum CCNP1411]|uniref:PhoD-like phosphatase n=1 Tax=Nostoc edaphicum CCNP1411 TaxID=1472755 RepID=A0A7D7QI86_9NOSO|nr:PhoD-like phosphatase [Nostoc edaphicum]QMS91142.1 PhoD-like phosphatase [Nostoc edaphicum CCNP1411]
MKYQVGDKFLQELPLILAGPILQHTEPESVTVWVALKQSCQVELKVYDTTDDGKALENCLLDGERSTFSLGKHLHVVAITARSTVGHRLTGGHIYAYDLQFTVADQTAQTLQQALCSNSSPTVSISYFDHQKPTFVLPPNCLQDLQIVHASCRKPHGHGFDALPILDTLIEAAANQPQHRPHQLFLTGDQIYGDDVSEPSLWVASTLGDALLGWEEQLPVNGVYCTPQQLPPGERSEVATNQAGLTAGLHNKPEKINSHLFSLGEYYATYLLAWSPVCWPTTFPEGHQVMRDRHAIKDWNRAVWHLRQLIYTLWKVRRALANIPMYTIFDDHDVSDDWNLNQAWCLRVLGRPLGRRIVQNALLAYTVFQAWGNTPGQFAEGQSGEKLLMAAQAWSASQGTDVKADEAIARYVGMPANDPHTGLPILVRDGAVFILDRHPEALTWHYIVRSDCHEVIVLDTRTWRGYPADQKAIAPPMLLCPQAFEQQLLLPLQEVAEQTQIQTTFVIAPTNVFGLQVIDWIHHWHLKQEKVFSTDVGDAWNINTEALAKFLTTLFEERQQVVILSGDIHYSSVAHLSYARTHSKLQSVLVQLTASALKNEEILTRLIHTRLKDWLLPEKVRHWIGWLNPPNMVEVSEKQLHHNRQMLANSDWHCVLEWIPRNSVQTSAYTADIFSLIAPWKRAKNAKWKWLQPVMFWKSRWFQEGREVVGLNNLALVHFELPDGGNSCKVIQDLYWFSSWYPTQIVYSRFESQLTPNQSLLRN